jgi:hypothetical protein
MRRHSTPPALLLLTLAALPCGLVAGCGGSGSTSTTAATGAAATTAAAATAASATRRAATTPATPRSAASAALAAQAYTPPRRRFAAAPIGAAAVSQLARTGSIRVPVAVGGPGRVSAFGQAQIPQHGILHVAEAAPRTAGRAGTVTLTLRLTPLARAQLAAHRSILMYLAISFSKGEVIQRMPVRLKP